MRYFLFIFAVGSVALFALAGPGLADPNLPDVVAHQHFVINAQGDWIPVGPQVCPAGTNPQLQQAFNQFHVNIHHSEIPPGVPIETLGPQLGAPGLHNGIGADMQGRPCSFVPPQ
jgi:hypothetical protein